VLFSRVREGVSYGNGMWPSEGSFVICNIMRRS